MNICPKCGATVEGLFCPECGTKIESDEIQGASTVDVNQVPSNGSNSAVSQPYTANLNGSNDATVNTTGPFVRNSSTGSALVAEDEKKARGFAIASLVCGIISICSLGALFIPEILGIVFALVSKNGKPMVGLAKAGLICSIIGFAILILIMFI